MPLIALGPTAHRSCHGAGSRRASKGCSVAGAKSKVGLGPLAAGLGPLISPGKIQQLGAVANFGLLAPGLASSSFHAAAAAALFQTSMRGGLFNKGGMDALKNSLPSSTGNAPLMPPHVTMMHPTSAALVEAEREALLEAEDERKARMRARSAATGSGPSKRAGKATSRASSRAASPAAGKRRDGSPKKRAKSANRRSRSPSVRVGSPSVRVHLE